MQSPQELLDTFFTLWGPDPARAMRMVAPDVVYTLNVSPDALLIGGETVGWEAVNAAMLAIREVFDYLVYRHRIVSVEANVVRARIELLLRHRATGELFGGHLRHVATVRDGLIVRVDEYTDAALTESFMRLVQAGAPRATA